MNTRSYSKKNSKISRAGKSASQNDNSKRVALNMNRRKLIDKVFDMVIKEHGQVIEKLHDN